MLGACLLSPMQSSLGHQPIAKKIIQRNFLREKRPYLGLLESWEVVCHGFSSDFVALFTSHLEKRCKMSQGHNLLEAKLKYIKKPPSPISAWDPPELGNYRDTNLWWRTEKAHQSIIVDMFILLSRENTLQTESKMKSKLRHSASAEGWFCH